MTDAADGPVALSALADLQAGLLADDAAARMRRRARSEPQAADQLAALNRVRRDVAALGVDEASAPDIPAAVSARIGTALRALPPPIGVRDPASGWRRGAALAGLVAAVAAAGIGSVVLVRDPDHRTPTTAASVAAMSRPPGGVPLSDDDILAVLDAPAELGPFASAQRLASCLGGLGYPTSTSPLGARPLAVDGRPGVLLLLAGDVPRRISAVVVGPNCSSADTGLLASTVVTLP